MIFAFTLKAVVFSLILRFAFVCTLHQQYTYLNRYKSNISDKYLNITLKVLQQKYANTEDKSKFR